MFVSLNLHITIEVKIGFVFQFPCHMGYYTNIEKLYLGVRTVENWLEMHNCQLINDKKHTKIVVFTV